MNARNPYAPPGVAVSDRSSVSAVERRRHRQIASGQRMVILALLGYFGSGLLAPVVGPLAGLLVIPALLLALVGVVLAAHGLWRRVWVDVLVVLLAFVPLVNLLALLFINNRATRHLRAAGYRVGLAGASVPSA